MSTCVRIVCEFFLGCRARKRRESKRLRLLGPIVKVIYYGRRNRVFNNVGYFPLDTSDLVTELEPGSASRPHERHCACLNFRSAQRRALPKRPDRTDRASFGLTRPRGSDKVSARARSVLFHRRSAALSREAPQQLRLSAVARTLAITLVQQDPWQTGSTN